MSGARSGDITVTAADGGLSSADLDDTLGKQREEPGYAIQPEKTTTTPHIRDAC
ncbi:hypothetical protein [Streptomyces cyaneofuscatus]|uniref:hypothetical protein n=1 Tax=Streptomyces cyaneofuscatus TaxID=66883 RepID=UPI00365A52AF